MLHAKQNIILFLIIFALFLGGTVEISEGSIPLGILLIILAMLLIARIKVRESYMVKPARLPLFIGVLILAVDIAYNLLTSSKLGTLDIMTFVLGCSLIAQNIKNEEVRRMGTFGAYMSATFIVLFLIFFSLFDHLGINFTHRFDHYVVFIPSVFLIKAIGIPIHVISTETVRIQGVEEMSVIIGGPCSGLYSMFLLIGIMVAYKKTEQIERGAFYSLLLISVVVAYLANLMRVTTLYLVAFHYGEDAMYLVHVHLGWIIFVIVVTVLFYVLDKLSRVTPSASS
ncbi:MAG: archaeosortase C [Methanophagales archaeon ANME-1-THS]|nr:MAG: archaeosortase C [Methanophagales archaeon ANME-1-THS]